MFFVHFFTFSSFAAFSLTASGGFSIVYSMTKPENPLASRRLSGNVQNIQQIAIPASTGNPILDANLYDIANRYCGSHQPEVLLQLLATVMNAAQSNLNDHDMRMLSVALKEMYEAEKLFLPYEQKRKITCFGSARIKEGTPAYQIAHDFARLCSEANYMIITGGGPGIMQACNEGALPDMSFGLNITLPFEQHPNPAIADSGKMLDFYYFFTRKLNLVKQADALVAFPGGFGTMDEIYETITLMQTGKATIFPIVLIDPAGDFFWSRWLNFVKKELLEEGLISPEDVDLLYITKDAEDAFAHIEHFYSRFHSYYFNGDVLSIRMHDAISAELFEEIASDYADIMPKGDLVQLDGCAKDVESQLAHLPRLRFTFNLGDYARLRQLINDINE